MTRAVLPVVALLSAAALSCHSSPKYFQVAKKGEVWYFVDQAGAPMWSFGVDCTNTGTPRDKWDPNNPSYAAWQHYATDALWASAADQRLRNWGFNTLGAWSDYTLMTGLPYVELLYLGSSVKAPFCDLWGPDVSKAIDDVAKGYILPLRDDTRLIGWFSDNEIGWWDDTIFTYTISQPSTSYTRRVLVSQLKSYYGNDFNRLKQDWNVTGAASFSGLDAGGTLTLKPGTSGMVVVNKFVSSFADKYYQLCRNAIRRYDTHHLYLGDRYCGWYPRTVAAAAGKYVDVISTNYGSDWLDGSLSHYYMDTLYRLTGKPILITEFYFCAMENNSGNKNTGGVFPTVQTQAERAKGYGTCLQQLVSLPYVIGAHWFQYYDEATNGRSDGEDYNMGLADIHDAPYSGMVASSQALHPNPLIRPARPKRDPGVVPSAPSFVLDGLRYWDKENGFILPGGTYPFADMYACWSQDTLYLAVHAAYYADKNLWGGTIPDADRMQVAFKLGTSGIPFTVRFGLDAPPAVVGASIPCKEWKQSVRDTILLSVPASLLGQTAFHNGDQVRLKATLQSPGRAEQMSWDQVLTLGF